MDRTAKAFPNTELMLCSGGGGRADYGALKYFHEFWPSDNTDPVRRVAMQWNYSYFFPAMTLAAHVTHWGDRPMHFACAVAMSARFGMDLDLAKLPAQDKAVCAGAISAYKRIRDVTHLSDLYRLEPPQGAMRGLEFRGARSLPRGRVRLPIEGGPAFAGPPAGPRFRQKICRSRIKPSPGTGRPPTGRQDLHGRRPDARRGRPLLREGRGGLRRGTRGGAMSKPLRTPGA
jgi:hypothetical protein